MVRVLACLLSLGVLVAVEGGSQRYRQAYQAGVAEAEADLVARTPRLLVYGEPSGGASFDRELGLPTEAIAGCIVDDGILGRAAGYNHTIRERHATHGSVPGDLTAWREVVLDPAAVATGGQPPQPGYATDPTGIYHLHFADGHLALVDPPDPESGADAEPAVRMPLATLEDGDALALHWGPPGSDLAVLVVTGPRPQRWTVIDLRRRLRLNTVVAPP